MDNKLQNTINEHLKAHRGDIDRIVAEGNLDQDALERMIYMISAGALDVTTIPDVLLEYNDSLTVEQAIEIQGKLYDEVFVDISDELDEVQEAFEKQTGQIYDQLMLEETLLTLDADDIETAYSTFVKSPEVASIVQELNNSSSFDEVKTNFYDAINTIDRVAFVTALAQLFNSGKLVELFKTDERYSKFWRNRILKEQGLDGVRRFDENSMKLPIFGKFIKYLMEDRFEIPHEQAVLWGVFLASLAHHSEDVQFEKLAYADVKDKTFKWNF